MATYTYVDLEIPEATTLADLHGAQWDLQNAQAWAKDLLAHMVATPPDLGLLEPLSIAVATMYSRPFVTGVRAKLDETDLTVFTPEQRLAHNRLRAYRDKHVAHSVNAFEENSPRANYCVERVHEEGITSISCAGARVLGMSSIDLNDIIELSGVMLKHVEARMTAEEVRLLAIVRDMPLDDILVNGQKSFTVCRDDRIHLRRKS